MSSTDPTANPNPDYHDWHEARVQTCLDHLATHLPRGRTLKMLDLGHDPKMGQRLVTMGGELTGNVYPGTLVPSIPPGMPWTFKAFDLEQADGFPFPDQSYDVVTAFEVIEHVLSTPRVLLRESARVLRPGGLLYLGTPNVCAWAKVRRLLSQVHPYDSAAYGQSFQGRHPMCHVYEYDPWTLQELVKSEGFEIIECATWDPYQNDPRGLRDLALRALVSGSLAVTGYVKDAAHVWRRRGHQIGLAARRV